MPRSTLARITNTTLYSNIFRKSKICLPDGALVRGDVLLAVEMAYCTVLGTGSLTLPPIFQAKSKSKLC